MYLRLDFVFVVTHSTHPHTHPTPPHSKDYTFISAGSPQLLPSCRGSAVTTATERRWHHGFPSPKSAWKRSWSATGPSASGTRCRRSSTRCTLRGSTRTVSGLLHLEYFKFPGCFYSSRICSLH